MRKQDIILVSIIIPVYNAEEYLNECIEAILQQSYKQIELILVNDGSSDNSQKIIEQKFESDNRIIALSQENSGAPAARNSGLRHASGQYLLFFDADDRMQEGAISMLVENAINTQADISIGNYNVINANGTIESRQDYPHKRIYQKNELIDCMLISPLPGNKLIKKEIVDQNKIHFINVRLGQDLNFYQKVLCVSERVIIDCKEVMSYRTVENSISRSYTKKIVDIIKSLDDVEEFYIKNKVNNEFCINLKNVRIRYYASEISKVPKIEKRNDRIEAMKCFKNNSDKIKVRYKDVNASLRKKYILLRLEITLWPLFCLNISAKAYAIIKHIIKGKQV